MLAEQTDKKILHLTYNSSLRKEFQERVEKLEINNIEVHTFHSFAVKYFLSSAYTDEGLREIVCNKLELKMDMPTYDIVVIDESQDLTPLYYRFVIYFLSHLKCQIQVVILGDPLQSLYEFKGSDYRFLTLAPEIWKRHGFLKTSVFKKCTLKMSYRLTNQMSEFINKVLYKDKFIYTCRDGDRVKYIRNNTYGIEKVVINIIKKVLDEGDLPNDIFILAASVSGVNSHVRKLENVLSELGISCYIPYSDIEKIDDRVINGRIVFSTFHSVKGRQRKHVFVVGFDNSYFEYYAKKISKDLCPNTMYVSCTRSTDKLYLLENNQRNTDKPLNFLNMNHHEMKISEFIDFHGLAQTIFYDNPAKKREIVKVKHITTPSQLIKYISESTLQIITLRLKCLFVDLSEDKFSSLEDEIPNVIELSDKSYEDVSDINGITIPCIYYDYAVGIESAACCAKECNLYELIRSDIKNVKDNEHNYLKKIFEELNPVCESISDYLFMSNLYIAVKEKLYFKLKHIKKKEYNWLCEKTINKCKLFMDHYIVPKCSENVPSARTMCQEKTIIFSSSEDDHLEIDDILSKYFPSDVFRFTARIDIETEDTVWEIKCTTLLSVDHFLQVIIYSWLWRAIYPKDTKKFKILNIKTAQVFELNASMEELTQIMVLLLENKFFEKNNAIADAEFVERYSSL